MLPGEKLKQLRERAEKTLKELSKASAVDNNTGNDLRKILHELQVHQIELEMQNEELRRTQGLLELEKKRYTDLFEYAPVGYVLLNKNGIILNVNQTFCNILEISKVEAINKSFATIINKESQDNYHFHLQELLSENQSSTALLNLKSRSGNDLWMKIESKVFFSEESNTYIIQSSLSDITKIKATEEQLLLLNTAFEQSANSIIITDTQGNIQYANPQFFKITGYTPAEAIGQNPRIIKHENSVIDYKELWETISSGNTWKGEFLNRSKKGTVYWELGTITPVKNNEGEIINYLAIKEDITKRKIAEQNLEKAKNFYLKLLEDFPIMVWQCDQKGNYNFFNNTMLEFAGLSFDELLKNGFAKLVPEKDRKIFNSAFKNGLKNKEPFVVEFRLKDQFGNYRWVMNHARPFTDIEGNYGGFIAACTDIHDRKVFEEKLMESEDRYRRMFEDSSLGIFKIDRHFQFLNANRAFAQMFGYDNTVSFLMDINNKPDKFFPQLEYEKEFRKNLVKSKETRFIIEKELFKKDKSRIHTLIHLRKVYDRRRDKQVYLEGFIEDITTRKMAEKRLLFSEQKYKALFEKSYDPILILDENKIIDCNTRAEELFQLRKETLVCHFFSGLIADSGIHDSGAQILKKSALALEGNPQTFECKLLRSNSPFDAEVSFARIFVRNRYMVQAIVRDVSEKKLAENQLKQARDDAEKARQAQSEFLSLMSHEIRTPLNAVVSLTDLMLHENQTPDQEENLSSVKVSAAHLLGLIDDILDYNKIESGNIQFETEEFDLRELIDTIIQALKIKAKEKGIRLNIRVDESVPKILKGDTLRLRQILLNLLSNAIKFTHEGSVTLSAENQKGNNILFEVKDTGIGISADRLNAIFEKFTQEKHDTSRKYGGSGLGLTICKKLIELQGGEIHAKSVVGQGSAFTFYLPMEKGKKLASKTKSQTKESEEYSLKGMKILLVEDDKMNQFVAQKIIGKKWEAHLVIISTGEEALELLEKEKFDLLLLDILLPGMDGYETTQQIRNNPLGKITNPNIPIVALTADAFVETRQKAFESGMDDFVSKPFDYEKLFHKINSYRSAPEK